MAAFIIPIQPMKTMEFTHTTDTKDAASAGAGAFSNVLSQAMQEYQSLNEASAENSANLALGNVDDLAKVQINTLKAESMLETTVQLTTRAVNAYKEIMQMSV
jgi:flagellar hook-basal body complex protein FliE